MTDLKNQIEAIWERRAQLDDAAYRKSDAFKVDSDKVNEVMDGLDRGTIRVAEPVGDAWQVNEWAKQSILLYFQTQKMEILESPPFEYYDKIPLKSGFESLGVRVVPGAVVRYGSYLARGVVLMPSFINIGGHVGEKTMIDTWATVGSCAQIGKGVHLSGGVGIGGVLEPLQASPVIIEDDCFVGSRSIVVEGVRVGRGAVLAANVSLTASTKIIDVSGENPVFHTAYIPPESVVVPGSQTKKFAAGEYSVNCALIIGKRTESTDRKTSLNDTLRRFELSV